MRSSRAMIALAALATLGGAVPSSCNFIPDRNQRQRRKAARIARSTRRLQRGRCR